MENSNNQSVDNNQQQIEDSSVNGNLNFKKFQKKLMNIKHNINKKNYSQKLFILNNLNIIFTIKNTTSIYFRNIRLQYFHRNQRKIRCSSKRNKSSHRWIKLISKRGNER